MPFAGVFSLHGESAIDPFALIDKGKTLTAADKITLSKYPDCDRVIVEEKDVTVFRKDGTGTSQQEQYIKVLTEKGKQDQRTLQLAFMLPYSGVEVPQLEIIKPGGTTEKVDVAAHSKESIDSSQMQENIYDPNSKILEVSIPDLEVGDVIHVVARDITKRAVMPGEFADETLLEGEAFILHQIYEVHAPPDKPLQKYVLRSEIPGTVSYTQHPGDDGTLIHRWETSGVPRLFVEPSMPPLSNVAQLVRVTTTPSWHDVSKWYWELSLPHLEASSPKMKRKVKELTAGVSDDLGKIRALFYYVSQNIRYMGITPEKDRPGFEPHDVSLSFDKKYGVCRDKAALLVAMLRLAGFKAYPVLVSVGTRKDADVPDAGFNHAIAAVEFKPGEYTLMDPTDEHARDLLPSYDGNQSYLVARPEGETIRTSPVIPPEQNMMSIRTKGILLPSGELQATSEFLFEGINDDTYRGAFSRMKPYERTRFFEKLLQGALPGARLISLKLTPENILDVSQKLHAEMVFTVSGLTAVQGGEAVVTLPWIGGHLGVLHAIMRGMDLDRRRYPLLTQITCGLNETISLRLGEGFSGVESLPSFTPRHDEGVSYDQQVTAEKGGPLECSREIKLKRIDFSPGQYLGLKQLLKDLGNDARKAPILSLLQDFTPKIKTGQLSGKASPVESNAQILDVRKRLEVTDAHTASYHVSYTKLILSYVGKTQESEIKVAFNPACEAVHFLHGTVTAASGEQHEIAPDEINVLDAESSASAKRYTGSKILVASLPSVEIGSTIRVEYEIAMKEKPFLAGFEPFQLADELQKKSVELTLPEGLKIKKLVSGAALAPTETGNTENGLQHFSWNVEGRKALPPEQGLPPSWFFLPGVTYFIGEYPAYLKELQQSFLKHSQSGPHAVGIAQKISAGSKTRLEVLRGIRDYVASTIRAAGPSFTELPLSELSDADVTLSDGYGHQADRAILLHAMLAAAGFHPEFILASSIRPIDELEQTVSSFPLPESFNIPLVKVMLDGAAYYLNDTDQYAELGTTAHDDSLAINLSSGESEVIHAAKNDNNRTESDYDLRIDDNGKLLMRVIRRFYGSEYNAKSRLYAELRPEERKRHFQELLSQVAQGARPVGGLTTHFDSYPGSEEFTVEIDNFAIIDGKNCYFTLPFTPSLIQLPAEEVRTLPLQISQQESKGIHATISFPPGYGDIVIAPKGKILESPAGTGKVGISVKAIPGKFLLTEEMETTPGIIGPEDYQALRTLESDLGKTSASLFLLKKTATLSAPPMPSSAAR